MAKKLIAAKPAKPTKTNKAAKKKAATSSKQKQAIKKSVGKAKVIKRTAKATKKANTGIKVEEIVHKVNPKLHLTDDALELLNALLTEKFTQIAEAASQIV